MSRQITSPGQKRERLEGIAFSSAYFSEHPCSMSASEGRPRAVKVKDLKPKRIKDYLEYKFSRRSPTLLKLLYFMTSRILFTFDSSQSLHSNSREGGVEKNTYLFDIERVNLKKRLNTVHVRDQKHELTPPRNR
ncbi:hypothetical protein GQ457_05G020450 [Hibiscus cannabinus]